MSCFQPSLKLAGKVREDARVTKHDPTLRLFRQPSPGDWNSATRAAPVAVQRLTVGDCDHFSAPQADIRDAISKECPGGLEIPDLDASFDCIERPQTSSAFHQ